MARLELPTAAVGSPKAERRGGQLCTFCEPPGARRVMADMPMQKKDSDRTDHVRIFNCFAAASSGRKAEEGRGLGKTIHRSTGLLAKFVRQETLRRRCPTHGEFAVIILNDRTGAAAVSTQMIRSSWLTMAAESAKSCICAPKATIACPAAGCKASSSPCPFCRLINVTPGTDQSGNKPARPGKERLLSFLCPELPFHINPTLSPAAGRRSRHCATRDGGACTYGMGVSLTMS